MLKFVHAHIPNCIVNSATATYFKARACLNNGFRGHHSNQATVNLKPMKIQILPALTDNYMYLITDETTKESAVVDPVEPDTVLQAVSAEGSRLTKILTTHHHWDHAGGNEQLVKKYPGPLQIIGGDQRIGALNTLVKDGDSFNIGNIKVDCIYTPCHTTGHICYYLSTPNQVPAVFTGDTLFVAGCGRFFEGTPEQMYTALVEKLSRLPDDTRVFCGHEYTVQNLKFAQTVDSNNPQVHRKFEWAVDKRSKGEPTIPSSIGEEKATNPFMRVTLPEIQTQAGCNSPIAAMQTIRKQKDNFTG
ncbi:unnamed protein product [Phyllotreta striolata]|uniref:hydroxyacylglutathione hydrolase n=1 Tax=Phyllotreta striolata TaxID=444603 RepID=A0A9N9TXV2_PHYSR|nr:unnamed protein product [Phyllotreta striolata]